MIPGRDSEQAPGPAARAAALAAGVGVWGGYLVSEDDATVLAARAETPPRGLHNLAAPWTLAELLTVQAAGFAVVAFCSGWDNAAAVGAKAHAHGLLPCLDDEDGIRPDGPWVQPWLDQAASGLYGLTGVHTGRTAWFHVAALYPADGCGDGLTWPAGAARPDGPLAWQCQGSHDDFGLTVDSGNYDDWFGQFRGGLMGAAESITINGLTIVAGLKHDGTTVRLVGSVGGLGGLTNQPGLDAGGPAGADLRHVFLGEDAPPTGARLLVGVVDAAGTVYVQAFSLDGTWTGSGWYQLTALQGWCRVAAYEGEVLPAPMLGNAPHGTMDWSALKTAINGLP